MDTVTESNSEEYATAPAPKKQLSRAVSSARSKLRQRLDICFQALQGARRATRERLDQAISRIGEVPPRLVGAARDTLENADRATKARLVSVEERVTSWLGPDDSPDAAAADS